MSLECMKGSVAVRWVAAGLCCVLALPVAGCEPAPTDDGTDTATRSRELTPGEFPDKVPPQPVQPPPPMLRTPESAVHSYLLWISFAYRILNSDVATQAFDEYEEVRVNSYVELNRQEGRAIDQRLLEFDTKSVTTEGSTATVSARESWAYRYISTGDAQYNSPRYEVTYDTTYTVVKKDQGWLVAKVDAVPVGEPPK